MEAEVQRRILESDEAAKELAYELETHIKPRSSGFYWFRVDESEKRLIELRRRRLLGDGFDDEHLVNCSTATLMGHHSDEVDDIPEALTGSSNPIHEKEVGEKLQQLEGIQEAMRAHISAEAAAKAELVAELEMHRGVQAIGERLVTELQAALQLSEQREAEVQANVTGLREALEVSMNREASYRADLDGTKVQLDSHREEEERHRLHSGLREALEASIGREQELDSDLETHREALRAALQRETEMRTELDEKDVLIRDAAEWRAAAEQREAVLQKLLKEAQQACLEATKSHDVKDIASPGSLLKFRLPSSTMLVDVVFPSQSSLGLVIVPHELFYDRMVVATGASPSKGLLRPLGEEPIVDCCMVTSSVIAHCVIAGDVLLSINGISLVCSRIEELHSENYSEEHFNKVMEIVGKASRPRRLRFLRLAHRGQENKSPATMKDARVIIGANRFLNEKEISIIFDERAAVQHTDAYEYTITTGIDNPSANSMDDTCAVNSGL